MTQTYRPEFEAALRLFARISDAVAAKGLPRPVLVGGAAVEFYSGGAMMTGDFDLCSPVQSQLEEEMQAHGFVKPGGAGVMTKGWVHPELGLGFEVVGSAPLDGQVDGDHLILVDDMAGDGAFVIISVEDLIADRMGQYASGTANDRLEQAQALYALHNGLDKDYLDKRIRFETGGDYGVKELEKG